MTDITNIPLNKLIAWEGNVRKTQNKGIDELAASMRHTACCSPWLSGRTARNSPSSPAAAGSRRSPYC
jgi:hypothetical protein